MKILSSKYALSNEAMALVNLVFANIVIKESESQSDLYSKLTCFYSARDSLMDCIKYTEEAKNIREKCINDPMIDNNYLEFNVKIFNRAKQTLERIDNQIEDYKTILGIS